VASKPEAADLLVLGGTVLPMNDAMDAIEDGGVAVKGGRVAAVAGRGEIEASYRAAEVVDARDCLVMPGLINTHGHTPMTILRGYGDDLPLDEWLNSYIWPWEHEHVNPYTVGINSKLAMAEMIRSGTTTFCDMYFFGAVTARVARDCGIRAVGSEAYAEGGPRDFDSTVAAARELMLEFADDELVVPSVSAHSLYAVSEEQLLALAEIAREFGSIYQIHLAETQDETATVLSQTGMRPVAYADRLGLLNEKTLASHCVQLNPDEIEVVASRGCGVSHTPQSEMKLASGISPVEAMIEAGVKVSLGTDGVASNNVLDIFEEMKAAALLAKISTGNTQALDARTVARLATIDGARAIGMEETLGSLEPGKLADITVVGLDSPHATPCHDPFSHLAYVLGGRDVRTVIINGAVVMKDREVLTMDVEEAISDVRGLLKSFD